MKEGQEERVFSLCTGSSWFIHGGVDYTDNKCNVHQRGERLREALQLKRVGGRG